MAGWKWLSVSLMVAALPWLLGASGCSGGSGLTSIDENTEINIGQQSATQLEGQYGVVYDPVQSPRIQRIGRSIAAVTQRPELPWSFKILNSTDVNAESLPGGPVYVTRGLLALDVSDSELAGVLGHEAAHINQRHQVKQIQQQMDEQTLEALVLGRSSAAVQSAVNLALQVGVNLPYSRQDEYEADALGIRFAYNAGYPARGLVQFLTRLQQISGPDNSPTFLRDHPLTPDRIARANQVVAQVSGQPRPVPVIFTEEEAKTLKQLAEEKPAVGVENSKGSDRGVAKR